MAAMRRRRFTVGETIFHEGEPSAEAYLVRSGRVEILKASAHGPIRLAVLGEGDVLGEMGLLEERPRSASARVVEDVVADAINAAEFAAMLTGDPSASLGILRVLFERLRAVNTKLSETPTAPMPAAALPAVRLVPLTPETTAGMPADGLVVSRFPFRVGRAPQPTDSSLLHFNELELADAEPYVLSPNHFAIDLGAQGLMVRDRGSLHGTVVNGVRVGAGSPTDLMALQSGDNDVVAGPARALAARRASPFRFRVVVS
jgi:CRP-like cAMP-binding protein